MVECSKDKEEGRRRRTSLRRPPPQPTSRTSSPWRTLDASISVSGGESSWAISACHEEGVHE